MWNTVHVAIGTKHMHDLEEVKNFNLWQTTKCIPHPLPELCEYNFPQHHLYLIDKKSYDCTWKHVKMPHVHRTDQMNNNNNDKDNNT